MSSPTTTTSKASRSTSTSGSTPSSPSPSAPPAKPGASVALTVRPILSLRYTARLLAEPASITGVDGVARAGLPGDYVVSTDTATIELCSPFTFASRYEIVTDGALTLAPHTLRQLDDLLGPGATRSAAALVAAVDRVASIRIGDVRLPFTPGQLEELAHRASKRGRSVEAEIAAVVDRIRDEIFHRGG